MEYEIMDEYLEQIAVMARDAGAVIEPHLSAIQEMAESLAEASAAFGPVLAEVGRSIQSYQDVEHFRLEAFIPPSSIVTERRERPVIDYDLIAEKIVERMIPRREYQNRASYPLPKGANLAKLKLKQIDGHTVKVKYPSLPTQTFDYKDFGMVNRKSYGPDAQWYFICAFFGTGRISKERFDRRLNRNAKYETNRLLKEFFHADEDFFYPYDRKVGEWIAKPVFLLASDTSFDYE